MGKTYSNRKEADKFRNKRDQRDQKRQQKRSFLKDERRKVA